MNSTHSKSVPEGYIRVPMALLRAGAALPLSIFLYAPIQKQIVCYRRKSEPLDITDLMELMQLAQSPSSLVLALTSEYETVARQLTGNSFSEDAA